MWLLANSNSGCSDSEALSGSSANVEIPRIILCIGCHITKRGSPTKSIALSSKIATISSKNFHESLY